MSMLINIVFKESDYKLAFNPANSNWAIYINSDGKALSIAKKSGCSSSFFGDKKYILKLIDNGHFDDDIAGITEYGRTVFSGAYSRLMTDSNGKRFSMLSFN